MTNGVNSLTVNGSSGTQSGLTRAALVDPAIHPNAAVDLSGTFLSTLKATNGSTGTIKSFIIPGNKTGVVRMLRYHPVPLVTAINFAPLL
jgi:hypothetical protein